MSISLYDHQRSALEKMKNGCILCGGVGSGKSRTALAYYYLQQGGNLDIPDAPMKNPLDIYIITTARKRDTCEWEDELAPFLLSTHEDCNYYKNKVVIDSWNNIGKYKDVKNSFFKVLEELKKQGHEIIAYDFPQDLLNAIYPTYMVLSCAEATSNNANLDGIRFGPNVENVKDYEDYIMKARTAGFSDMIKRRFIIGSFSLLAENQDELFRNAQRARRLIVNELNKFFEVADHLVLPASPSVAPLISSVTTTWSKKPDFVDNHMALANFSGSPSITLPLGFKNDLPFGINITTRPFEEKKLFDIALNIEEITKLKDLVANKEEK